MLPNAPPPLNEGQPALLAHALAYARRGWSIIPVIGKKPAGLWKPFQKRPADEKTLRRLFARKGITGLAVVLGRVSGGLAVRDFDDASAFHAWAAQNPEDAGTLPTVRTARGFHVYGRLDEEAYATLPDGELRADSGHYIVLPPSQHPDGPTYAWLNPLPDGPLPLLPASLIGDACRQETQQTQGNPRQHSQPIACARTSSTSAQARELEVEQAITATLPTGAGQRNACLFRLARALKGFLPDATPTELRNIVGAWHLRALPVIRTKDFGESWSDFVTAWKAIRHPAGGALTAAAIAAASLVLPGIAAGYDGHLYRLAAFCAALQAQAGDGTFFLGSREAAKHLGIDKGQAWRLLKTLEFDGLLRLVTKGTKASTSRRGQTSTWKYIRRER
jgi:hypothetical protein